MFLGIISCPVVYIYYLCTYRVPHYKNGFLDRQDDPAHFFLIKPLLQTFNPTPKEPQIDCLHARL